MKSLSHLRREIDLRRRVDELQELTGDHLEGWGGLAQRANREGLRAALRDVSNATGDFEWAFEGKGVYGDRIAMNRFIKVISPLASAVRRVSLDLLLTEGPDPELGVTKSDLAEPVLTGTFIGSSFGVRLSRAPVLEQSSLLIDEPLFGRAAGRIMSVFSAAHEDNATSAILDALQGFRQPTLNALANLSDRMIEADAPTLIRWRSGELLVVRPPDAETVREVIGSAEPHEEEIPVLGVLRGADLDSGQFHIAAVDAATGKDKHYRGKADSVALAKGIPLGSPVRATILVMQLESPVRSDKPRETYVLRSVELATDVSTPPT